MKDPDVKLQDAGSGKVEAGALPLRSAHAWYLAPKHRRWVVEAAHSWFNRFRKLLVRFEKLHESYLALVHLAAAIICFRKAIAIYG